MLLFVVTHHALFRVQPDGINLTLSGCQACDDPLSGTPTCLEALNAALGSKTQQMGDIGSIQWMRGYDA